MLSPFPALKDLVLEGFVPHTIIVPEDCRVHAVCDAIMPASAEKWLHESLWKGPGFSLAAVSFICQ